ncbi:LOW QUALITY PROTEIN: hypothetical protein BC938DRAFT_472252, partial [Jimgerdemannia flammicorona]
MVGDRRDVTPTRVFLGTVLSRLLHSYTMSSIEKLLIRGFRSFDPNGTNVIEFYSPLTLIVGHNGSGKTTMILALLLLLNVSSTPVLAILRLTAKVAHSFTIPRSVSVNPGTNCLHLERFAEINPDIGIPFLLKVAHETEVLAQVKLKFHNVNGRQMVCTRSIQVLQQKNKLSVKTLESSLLAKDPETGEQVSISARCADIDSDIPLHLGASQAILDNVIFCHQEESFWPLSESGVLKKKFDEIFASTKYTRALDNIKTLRKEQSQEIREDRIKLDHLQANKEKAEEVSFCLYSCPRISFYECVPVGTIKNAIQRHGRLLYFIRSMLETTRVQIDTYKNSVGELDMKIGSLTEELEERMEKQQKYQDIVSSIKELEGERARLTKSQDDLAPYFELLLESKQELDRLMDQHTSKLAKHDGTKYELEKRMNRKSDDLNQLRSALTKIAGQKSVMQAELEAHNQEILKRDEVIRMISRERNFKGYESSSFSSEDVRSILAKLKAQVEERESRVERIKTDLRKQECGITENLTALNKTLAAHVEGRRNARSQMDSNRQKIERLKEQLNKLEVSEAELGFLQNKLRDEERALNDASTKRDSGDMEAMLDAKRREKSQVDDQIKRFHDEIRSLTQQVDTRAKLELMRSDMEKKSGEISETLESCKKDFKACVGHDPTPQNMMHDINQLLLSKNRQIRTCEDSSEKAKRELTSISTKLKSANASLQRKSRQRGDIVAAITPVCNNQDLPSVLAEIETGLMDVRDQYAGLESAASLYGKFKQKSEKDRNCALCTRAFSKQVDLESFLRSLIDRVPVQKLELERNIEDLERRRDELREMRPQWDTLVRLNEIEIPEHNHEIEEQERRKLVAEKDVKETATEMEILKEEIKSITDLRKQAENIARIDKEKKKIGSDIRQLEQDLRISGSTKTIDDCQRECGELQIRRYISFLGVFASLLRIPPPHFSLFFPENSGVYFIYVRAYIDCDVFLEISNNIQRELEELNKENLAMERDISVKTNRRHVTRGKLTDLEHSFAERDRLQREIEQFHDDNKIQANKEKV